MMMGNYHARFLEGKAPQGRLTYSTRMSFWSIRATPIGDSTELIHRKPECEDGDLSDVHGTGPIAFNPFYTGAASSTSKSGKVSKR
ncbi:MAG: hypothetical protein ACLR8Y_16225 [Alistipes indistinctus]